MDILWSTDPLKLAEHALLAHRTSVIRQECGEDNGEYGETQRTRSAHHLHPAKKKQAADPKEPGTRPRRQSPSDDVGVDQLDCA